MADVVVDDAVAVSDVTPVNDAPDVLPDTSMAVEAGPAPRVVTGGAVVEGLSGPLPGARTFTSSGGSVLLMLYGSGFSATGNSRIGADLLVDGSIRSTAVTWTTEPNSHKTFATAALVEGLSAGSHSILVQPMNSGTSTDANDVFQVRAVEFSGAVTGGGAVVEGLSGPLPGARTFTSSGGSVLLMLYGSGFSATGNSRIGADLLVDGAIRSTAVTWTTEPNSHKAFATAALVEGLSAGSHSILVQPMNSGTSTDANDDFQVRAVEFVPSFAAGMNAVEGLSGPLPGARTFTASGGPVLLLMYGSGFSMAGNSRVGADLVVDGAIRSTAIAWATEANSRRSFATGAFVTGLAAGSHSILVQPMNSGTSVDMNDAYQVRAVQFAR